jgi:hypothetical protein
MMVRLLLQTPGLVERTTVRDRQKLITIADALGLDPDWISTVIAIESRWNPRAKNPNSSASGLIQFIESTARSLGTTTTAIRSMSTSEQLELVKRYFEPYARRIKSVGDAWLAVFYPAALGKDDSHVVAAEGSQAYAVNANLDKNKDRAVTVREIKAVAERVYNAARALPPIAVPYPPGQPEGPVSPPTTPHADGDAGAALLLVALALVLGSPIVAL